MEPIPQEVLDAAYRRLLRRVAAMLINAMAYRDMNFNDIGTRLGVSGTMVRRWIIRMAEGLPATKEDLRPVSDLAVAMGYEIEISARPYKELPDPAPSSGGEVNEW